ncbi:MAG: MotA/TolQ/ExbB proton channel family protein [Verrucomicrobiae bacterium]
MHLKTRSSLRSARRWLSALGATPLFFLAMPLAGFAQEVIVVPPKTSLWEIAVSGGVVMIPITALSVLAVMLVLVYFVTLRRGAVATARFMQTADALLRKKDYLGLLAISNRHNEAVAKIVQRTLEFLTKNPRATIADAREIAQTEGARLAGALNQQITYLADIGTVAPMLGLFGTVLGMIKSFTVVASDIAASRPMLLAQGISEALIATAAGLLVGIPAMMAYSFFRGRVQARISDLEAASTQLIALLGMGMSGRPE